MTFGDYFHKLLLDKKVNIHQLAEKAGIKNRTEIYRMFDNKCSPKKIKELTKKILPLLDLNQEENNTLQKLIQEGKTNSNSKKSNAILEELYLETKSKTNRYFTKIENFLKNNKNSKIKLYMGYRTNYKFSLFLDNFLSLNEGYDISIIHAVNFNKSDEIVANELFAIIKLLTHDEYSCFEVSKVYMDEVVILANNGKKSKLLVLKDHNKLIQSEISQELYNYLGEKYESSKKGKPLKYMRDKVTNLVDTVSDLSPVETNDFFSFEGVFCFGDIPFEIMHTMLKDSNFFGFPQNSQYISELVDAVRIRYENKLKSNVTRTYIMSEARITDFLTTGKTIDHVGALRVLTSEEVSKMVKTYIESDKFKYRFFKSGYSNQCIELAVAKNFGIIIWDAARGYGKKHFQTIISHPKVMKIVDSFREYFWENCTLSDEESKLKFNELIKKYL